MSRDNTMRASVAFDVEELLCNEDPAEAMRQYIDKLRDEFGISCRITNLVCSFRGDDGLSRYAVPNHPDDGLLARGQYAAIKQVTIRRDHSSRAPLQGQLMPGPSEPLCTDCGQPRLAGIHAVGPKNGGHAFETRKRRPRRKNTTL